jgi:hypothetical protein
MTTRTFLIAAVWAPVAFAVFSIFFMLALIITGVGYLAFAGYVTWRLLRFTSPRDMGRFFSWTPVILLPFQLAWLASLDLIMPPDFLGLKVSIAAALMDRSMFLLLFGYMYVGAVGILHWLLTRMDLIVDKPTGGAS